MATDNVGYSVDLSSRLTVMERELTTTIVDQKSRIEQLEYQVKELHSTISAILPHVREERNSSHSFTEAAVSTVRSSFAAEFAQLETSVGARQHIMQARLDDAIHTFQRASGQAQQELALLQKNQTEQNESLVTLQANMRRFKDDMVKVVEHHVGSAMALQGGRMDSQEEMNGEKPVYHHSLSNQDMSEWHQALEDRLTSLETMYWQWQESWPQRQELWYQSQEKNLLDYQEKHNAALSYIEAGLRAEIRTGNTSTEEKGQSQLTALQYSLSQQLMQLESQCASRHAALHVLVSEMGGTGVGGKGVATSPLGSRAAHGIRTESGTGTETEKEDFPPSKEGESRESQRRSLSSTPTTKSRTASPITSERRLRTRSASPTNAAVGTDPIHGKVTALLDRLHVPPGTLKRLRTGVYQSTLNDEMLRISVRGNTAFVAAGGGSVPLDSYLKSLQQRPQRQSGRMSRSPRRRSPSPSAGSSKVSPASSSTLSLRQLDVARSVATSDGSSLSSIRQRQEALKRRVEERGAVWAQLHGSSSGSGSRGGGGARKVPDGREKVDDLQSAPRQVIAVDLNEREREAQRSSQHRRSSSIDSSRSVNSSGGDEKEHRHGRRSQPMARTSSGSPFRHL
jgi:hypothetical protein